MSAGAPSEANGAGGRVQARVTLRNSHGLHARPAHLFVQTANAYASSLKVAREGDAAVDGKSIMNIMMLAAEVGTTLELVAEGPDSRELIRAIEELVANNFGEED